ncbi:hypothetical protein GCM10022236_48550 [Microlunatus ginsengisoli]|uniref:Uncharacterized protein n=1 Tax=Microlunatus ginsengisoli TaxID=363863 RepID=A0ABP7AUZ2_9ACTN
MARGTRGAFRFFAAAALGSPALGTDDVAADALAALPAADAGPAERPRAPDLPAWPGLAAGSFGTDPAADVRPG